MYHMYTQYKIETDIGFQLFKLLFETEKKCCYEEQGIAMLKNWSQLMRKVNISIYMQKQSGQDFNFLI